MDSIYYDMIFKRKSFHIFKEIIPLSNDDIQMIEQQIKQLVPLRDDIKVNFRIVPKSQTNCKRGEYCVLIYSEIKENYLQMSVIWASNLTCGLRQKISVFVGMV